MISYRCALLSGIVLYFAPLGVIAEERDLSADEALLRSAKVNTDGPALLEFFRRQTLTETERGRLAAAIERLGDFSYAERERATADLILAGWKARGLIKGATGNPDLEVARRAERCLQVIENGQAVLQTTAAARLLVARRPAGGIAVLLDFLPAAADEVIEEEVFAALTGLGLSEGKADPVLEKTLAAGEPMRRAAAALVVGRSTDARQQASVRRLLGDGDVLVRLRAAQGLIAGKDKDAVPALISLLAEAPQAQAWQVEELLSRLAGDQAPAVFVAGGAEADRRKARDAWAAWWRQYGSKIDLKKIELEQRPAGLTLVVCYDGYQSSRGKVWEMGMDGKARWEITDVQGPIDAQVLPGNRVLIAEHGARRITERTLQGRILWDYHVNNSPVACQRLPNGNTFLATYNEVLEVTPEQRALYTYPTRQGLIFSAQKLRNGHLVYVTMNGMLVELDEMGREVNTLRVGPTNGWVTVELQPRGSFLIPQQTVGKVVEFDAKGNKLWEAAAANPNCAARTANGNVLVCSNNDRTIREINRGGKVVWEQRLEGRPFRVRRR